MPNPPPKPAGPPWRKRLALALAILVVASVAGRVALRSEARAAAAPRGAGGLVANAPSSEPAPEAERRGLPAALPYVTEGGVAMLLGLGLGIATRAAYKLAIVLLALLFVALQYLAHKGVLAVDWGAFASWIEASVLNVAGETGIGTFVQHKLPAAAALALGLYLGLRR
jgi:uncharacterized membrane protein (Fun14 family)